MIAFFSRPPSAARRLLAVAVLWLAAAATAPLPSLVFAHEGHDHGPPPPSLPMTVKPRLSVHSDTYELVAVANGAALTVFLDRFATNEPVTDAHVTLMAGGESLSAEPRPDGTYRLKVPGLAEAGRHELIFSIAHKEGDDLLAGEIVVGQAIAAPLVQPQPSIRIGAAEWLIAPAVLAGAALVGLLLGVGIGLRRGRRSVACLAVAVMLIAIAADAVPTRAHEGHGHSPAPSADSLTGDIPRRLPDGSVFLPKPSQRLLTVRSQLLEVTEAQLAERLVGRIIADPNRTGLVQSIAGGRVGPPSDGLLPRLGQRVSKGDILASVTPALPLADQSTLADKQRELEGALDLARQRLSRLERLGGTSTPRGQIDDIEREVLTLEQRLSTLRSAKVQPETLEAPVDGIIAMSRAVAGQVIQAQDVLFQIFDPAHLWVEALAFGATDPGSIGDASAILPDGTVIALESRGRGRALQTQAIAVQFAILKPPAQAALGMPVTVLARKNERVKGFLLPRDAVVRAPGGDNVVWQHVDPERFVARPVRIEQFDGARVLVTAGVAAKDRIVVHAAELLSQIR